MKQRMESAVTTVCQWTIALMVIILTSEDCCQMHRKYDLQYADGAELVGVSQGLQRALDSVSQPYRKAYLTFFTTKTEAMTQLQQPLMDMPLTIEGQELRKVYRFK